MPTIFKARHIVTAQTRLDAIKAALDEKANDINTGETLKIEIDCGAGDQSQRFTVSLRNVDHFEYQTDLPRRFKPD